MIIGFASRWFSFLRDRRGNVAIITALAAIPMFGMLGFAIDYGIALTNKAKLDAAADAASLVAIHTAQSVLQAGGTTATALSQADTAAQQAFAANAGTIGFAATPTLVTPITSRTGLQIQATASYSGSITTNLSSLIGISHIPLRGSSASTLTLTTYIDFDIIVDISQSMGIGATQTDMSNLYSRTASMNGEGCVFGCHVKRTGPYTNEYVAHSGGPWINLRIDAAKSAIQTIIAKASANAGGVGNIRIGLYTMSLDPTNGNLLTTVSAPSSDYTALASAAGTIDLGNNTPSGLGDTDPYDSLTQFNSILTTQGDGSSATSPLKYVIIITDGADDIPGPCNYFGHCTGAFSPSNCTPLKFKASVGVIYTTYQPIYNNNNPAQGYDPNYQALVLPFVSQIPGNLQSCATSPSMYFEASDGAAITTALNTFFASTTQLARITR